MRRQLGEVLVGWKIITDEQLGEALRVQRESTGRERLGRILLVDGLIDELQLSAALGEVHQLKWVNLDGFEIDPEVARSLPQIVTERFGILPIARTSDAVTVAVADPVDVIAMDELKARLHGNRVDIVVAPASQIRARLEFVWGDRLQHEAARFVHELPGQGAAAIETDDPDAGAMAMVNQLLSSAARRRASDLHIEPLAEGVRVRIRVDGILHRMLDLPRGSLPSIVSRLKIMSELDVMERRLPQDGRARLRIEGLQRDIRLSTMPTIYGEKIVIRLLPTQEGLPKLSQLGMTEDQQATLVSALSQSQGFVLVTGPTGAGKSNTLYSAMTETFDEQRNALTLEDPVEVELAGISQVQINEAVGLSFQVGLRSALRQDPDLVMVGEIRDLETGQMAVRAALTGHLVISTLHTLDAPSAVVRLLEMGVPTYLVVTSLSLVVAQRLVRRPCRMCAQPTPPDADTQARLQIPAALVDRMIEGRGCRSCEGTGYRGRIGVFEVMTITPAIRDVLLEGHTDEAEIRRVAREDGWKTLIEQGVEMAAAGQTTAPELLRVLTQSG
jgi:type IV pilus assembly protein PilB